MSRQHKTQIPGTELPPADAGDAPEFTNASSPDEGAVESSTPAVEAFTPVASPAPASPKPKAAPAPELPDAADVDPATIPYGRTVLTKQGHVCSTAEDPGARRPR